MGRRVIGMVAVFGVVVAVGACLEADDGPVAALNPLTGESGLFPDGESVPPGWERCEEESCDDVRDELCPDEACGPALGMPSYFCDDGTLAGPTGRCLLDRAGTCSWEIRGCEHEPPSDCTESECGPTPLAPAILCEDGSIGGNTGRCLRGADGACGWELRDCPDPDPDLCGEDACGPFPGMPAWECEDGSLGGNTGRCIRGEDGTCGWEIRACP